MICRSLAAAALLSALAAPAGSGTALVTTPFVDVGAGAEVSCVVQNLDGAERTLSVRQYDEDAVLLAESVETPFPPGVRNGATTVGPVAGAYCQFQGLNRKVRGFITVRDAGQSVVVLPAAK